MLKSNSSSSSIEIITRVETFTDESHHLLLINFKRNINSLSDTLIDRLGLFSDPLLYLLIVNHVEPHEIDMFNEIFENDTSVCSESVYRCVSDIFLYTIEEVRP
jgi:hypothetical protein